MVSYLLKDDKIISRCVDEIKRSVGYEVVIRKPVRSQASNRYYWGILNIIAKEVGNDSEDLHDMLKIRVLGPQYITVKGEDIAIPKRSRDLVQKDFNQLTQAAEMLAMSFNIKLPAYDHYGD